jgi:hypothetical protein
VTDSNGFAVAGDGELAIGHMILDRHPGMLQNFAILFADVAAGKRHAANR